MTLDLYSETLSKSTKALTSDPSSACLLADQLCIQELCRYFGSARGCNKHDYCTFSHCNPNLIPLCRVGPKKCRYGRKCRFRHKLFAPPFPPPPCPPCTSPSSTPPPNTDITSPESPPSDSEMAEHQMPSQPMTVLRVQLLDSILCCEQFVRS